MCCGEGSARGKLWTAWWVVNLVGMVHFVLSFITFNNLLKAFNQVRSGLSDVMSLMVAVFIAAFLILVYAVFSFLLLLCKSLGRSRAGFGYGFVTSSAFSLAIILLLCSFMLTGSKTMVVNKLEKDEENWGMDWSVSETTLFSCTTYMGFILSAGYFALFALLMFYSTSIGDPVVEQVSYKEDLAA